MRMTTIDKDDEIKEFAVRAAISFMADKKLHTYTDDEIESGCFFALKFGADSDCIVVFKLDETFEPINFQQIITIDEDK